MADKQAQAAKKFAERWAGESYEKGKSQTFWLSLLRDVYGVEHPEDIIIFEEQVHIDHTSFIDGHIPSTKVLIEQKGANRDPAEKLPQSDGKELTPYEQAARYITGLPLSEHPRWVVICNFKEFLVYDMEHPQAEPQVIYLKDLGTDYYRLQFLVDTDSDHVNREVEVSKDAGRLVGLLYDAFAKQYKDPTSPHTLHSLNVLCVRLVFCLYAENSGIFGRYAMFHDYMEGFETRQMRKALIDLFHVLDTKEEDRNEYLADDNPELAAFPYVNGGLFSDENIEIPPFTEEIRTLLLDKASAGFNWSEISPTIFGAVFESTLNPETRRSGGMHYTSIENIHKVIDPLFLNDLKAELDEIKDIAVERTRNKKLEDFQKKLASLVFLDPACGSGNFLTETYLSIRRLENDVLRELKHGQMSLGLEGINPIQVSLNQFYGIEINDFAVTVAKTALWIAEHQMMRETESIVLQNLEFLPLKSYTNIVEGNAVQIDWNDVVPKYNLNYIMGNPPFSGARMMNAEQKKDVNLVFSGWKNVGNLDYVSCWYKKAVDYMKNTDIRTALVSTNSISQGESVYNLWKPLMEDGVHIDFAYQTFIWDSEAAVKAHVHCVIIGFSLAPNSKPKVIYTDDGPKKVNNINAYLIDADNVFIGSRNKAICNVPDIGIGNMPLDGGYYLFTEEEMQGFIAKEPNSEKFFRPWWGSKEFINRKPRYCLYLKDCEPNELKRMPLCMERVDEVQKFRSESPRSATKRMADYPLSFGTTNIPNQDYLVIPKVSSERRRYVPIGLMNAKDLCSDLVFIVPDITLYHFGVLTSNVHMSWMRAVCGRMKSDYRYSKDVVYNNFPWPDPTNEQKAQIEQTAQAILNARAAHPDSSFADLYDVRTMPEDLLKAHGRNDKAVMAAYGWTSKDEAFHSEEACVAELMKMYQQLVQNEK